MKYVCISFDRSIYSDFYPWFNIREVALTEDSRKVVADVVAQALTDNDPDIDNEHLTQAMLDVNYFHIDGRIVPLLERVYDLKEMIDERPDDNGDIEGYYTRIALLDFLKLFEVNAAYNWTDKEIDPFLFYYGFPKTTS